MLNIFNTKLDKYHIKYLSFPVDKTKITKALHPLSKRQRKANETTFQPNKSTLPYGGGASDGSNATKRS